MSIFNFYPFISFFLVNLGSPQEVRVDMYVANIWAMEEVKMVTIISYSRIFTHPLVGKVPPQSHFGHSLERTITFSELLLCIHKI